MITVITCTGHRPKAFELCVQYMKAQTYKESIQWIVINDDTTPEKLKPLLTKLPTHIKPELYQGPELWKPGMNTLRSNLEQAVLNIKGEKILVMEDDDYYSPSYITVMDNLLDASDIAGEANASYYNIRIPGWKRMQNYNQASLCQTGFRATLLEHFKTAMRSDGNIDGNLWEYAHKSSLKAIMVADFNLCIGMKGLPGRTGIGVGHKTLGYIPDPTLAILRKWLGTAAIPYIEMFKEIRNGIQTSKTQEPLQGRAEITPTGKSPSGKSQTKNAINRGSKEISSQAQRQSVLSQKQSGVSKKESNGKFTEPQIKSSELLQSNAKPR